MYHDYNYYALANSLRRYEELYEIHKLSLQHAMELRQTVAKLRDENNCLRGRIVNVKEIIKEKEAIVGIQSAIITRFTQAAQGVQDAQAQLEGLI